MTQPQLEADGLRVYSMADKLLTYIRDAALEAQVDLPINQYVTSGGEPPDMDKGTVSVTVLSLTTGLPSANMPTLPPAEACSPSWSVVLELRISRCEPKVNTKTQMPSPSGYTQKLIETSSDTGVLMGAIDKLRNDPWILGNIAASISLPPYEGGMVPVSARVTVGLP